MNLYEKIINLYPELSNLSIKLWDSYIELKNDSDGKGDYIAKWEHTLPKPTDEELA
jgi:hypothetical protein